MIIKGKYAEAECYASIIEQEAIDQIKTMCDYPFTIGSSIRIMPDVHAGAGCTIGTTMTITERVVPNIVGVDIGCGVYVCRFEKPIKDLKQFDKVVHEIPSGRNIWEHKHGKYKYENFKCYEDLIKGQEDRFDLAIGTLGGGNHFIEIDKDEQGNQYLVIHTGSRNLGKQIAEYYQQKAIDYHKGLFNYKDEKERLIRVCKEQGRERDIQKELERLNAEYKAKTTEVPEDLCWLEGDLFRDYINDMKYCQQYASMNRNAIASHIIDTYNSLGGEQIIIAESFTTVHNYIDTEEMILRKGAVAAHKDEKLIIPINMRDGSIIAVGKGVKEWNYSAPHGAGRLMSRRKAREKLDVKDFKEQMKGIFTSTVNTSTLDEAPMAYKSIDDIIDIVKETVDIIDIVKPIYNFKASE